MIFAGKRQQLLAVRNQGSFHLVHKGSMLVCARWYGYRFIAVPLIPERLNSEKGVRLSIRNACAFGRQADHLIV